MRRTITVDIEVLTKINKFRAEQLVENIDIDFTSAINLFAALGLMDWKSKDKDFSLERAALYLKHTGKSLGEAAFINTLSNQTQKSKERANNES